MAKDERVKSAFPLQAHRTPAGVQLSLAAWPRCELVELTDPIEARDRDQSAKRLRFDPTAEEDDELWIDSGSTAESLTDAQNCLYLAGERRLCYFHAGAGRFIPVDAAQWHLGKLDEPLAAGGSATVSIWRMTEEGAFDDSGLDVAAHDWLLADDEQLPEGTRVVVQFLVHARAWIVTQADACAEAAE